MDPCGSIVQSTSYTTTIPKTLSFLRLRDVVKKKSQVSANHSAALAYEFCHEIEGAASNILKSPSDYKRTAMA